MKRVSRSSQKRTTLVSTSKQRRQTGGEETEEADRWRGGRARTERVAHSEDGEGGTQRGRRGWQSEEAERGGEGKVDEAEEARLRLRRWTAGWLAGWRMVLRLRLNTF